MAELKPFASDLEKRMVQWSLERGFLKGIDPPGKEKLPPPATYNQIRAHNNELKRMGLEPWEC